MKKWFKRHRRCLITCGAILVLSIVISRYFFRSGYFLTDDGEWAIIRLASMMRILKSGQFPARWSYYLNHGYGYPLFNFVYPLPYYLGVPLSFIFGLINTIKLEFALTVLLSGLGMYVLVKNFWGQAAGLLAAGFYLLAPFRLVNLYVRGSLGESWAMAFYPWIFWAIKTRRWLLTGFLLAGLILSHNVSALFFIPIAFIYSLVIFSKHSKHDILNTIYCFVTAFALSAFFWLPALLEKKYLILSQSALTDKSQHFISLSRLLFSPWGYGSPLSDAPFTFQIGWPAMICASLGFVLSLRSKKRNKFLKFGIWHLAFLIFTMLPISEPFWNLSLLNQVDFPWRLLGPASFFLSLSAVSLAQKKAWRPLVVGALVLSAFLYLPQAKPAQSLVKSDGYYYSNDATTTSADELMPVWVKQKPLQRPAEPLQLDFSVNLNQAETLTINQLYFPGWQAWVDDQAVAVQPEGEQGLIGIPMPVGQHDVKVKLTSTPIQKLSNLISLFSLIGILLAAIINLIHVAALSRCKESC
ncbi:hypothetical protein KKD62_01975 [Patescibacteria group bacterium]|nr:hypothetical protein [Patescibacteria group bacterium]MBU1931229.1 hypothetical protein [Patescibacteria group bacterium]